MAVSFLLLTLALCYLVSVVGLLVASSWILVPQLWRLRKVKSVAVRLPRLVLGSLLLSLVQTVVAAMDVFSDSIEYSSLGWFAFFVNTLSVISISFLICAVSCRFGWQYCRARFEAESMWKPHLDLKVGKPVLLYLSPALRDWQNTMAVWCAATLFVFSVWLAAFVAYSDHFGHRGPYCMELEALLLTLTMWCVVYVLYTTRLIRLDCGMRADLQRLLVGITVWFSAGLCGAWMMDVRSLHYRLSSYLRNSAAFLGFYVLMVYFPVRSSMNSDESDNFGNDEIKVAVDQLGIPSVSSIGMNYHTTAVFKQVLMTYDSFVMLTEHCVSELNVEGILFVVWFMRAKQQMFEYLQHENLVEMERPNPSPQNQTPVTVTADSRRDDESDQPPSFPRTTKFHARSSSELRNRVHNSHTHHQSMKHESMVTLSSRISHVFSATHARLSTKWTEAAISENEAVTPMRSGRSAVLSSSRLELFNYASSSASEEKVTAEGLNTTAGSDKGQSVSPDLLASIQRGESPDALPEDEETDQRVQPPIVRRAVSLTHRRSFLGHSLGSSLGSNGHWLLQEWAAMMTGDSPELKPARTSFRQKSIHSLLPPTMGFLRNRYSNDGREVSRTGTIPKESPVSTPFSGATPTKRSPNYPTQLVSSSPGCQSSSLGELSVGPQKQLTTTPASVVLASPMTDSDDTVTENATDLKYVGLNADELASSVTVDSMITAPIEDEVQMDTQERNIERMEMDEMKKRESDDKSDGVELVIDDFSGEPHQMMDDDGVGPMGGTLVEHNEEHIWSEDDEADDYFCSTNPDGIHAKDEDDDQMGDDEREQRDEDEEEEEDDVPDFRRPHSITVTNTATTLAQPTILRILTEYSSLRNPNPTDDALPDAAPTSSWKWSESGGQFASPSGARIPAMREGGRSMRTVTDFGHLVQLPKKIMGSKQWDLCRSLSEVSESLLRIMRVFVEMDAEHSVNVSNDARVSSLRWIEQLKQISGQAVRNSLTDSSSPVLESSPSAGDAINEANIRNGVASSANELKSSSNSVNSSSKPMSNEHKIELLFRCVFSLDLVLIEVLRTVKNEPYQRFVNTPEFKHFVDNHGKVVLSSSKEAASKS